MFLKARCKGTLRQDKRESGRSSAEAGFAVGHYEVGDFFICVEFYHQPG